MAITMLSVDADDDDQARLASRIMDRLGGIDVNERTSGAREKLFDRDQCR